MAISRAELLKELLPGINKLLGIVYPDNWTIKNTGWFKSYFIKRTNKGRYQVWSCGNTRTKLIANNIKHRREAMAVIKLLNATKEDNHD